MVNHQECVAGATVAVAAAAAADFISATDLIDSLTLLIGKMHLQMHVM